MEGKRDDQMKEIRERNRDMIEAVCGILYSLEEFFERASGQTTDYDDFIIRSRTLRHMLKEGSDG